MIDVSMMRFIISYRQNHFSQASIRRQIPVLNGDFRRCDVFAEATVDISEVLRIAENCFFLEVSDNTVGSSRRAESRDRR